jgi:LysM repeat protein
LSQLKEVNGIPARLPGMTGLTILVPDNSEQSGGDVAAAGFSAAALSAAASVVMHIVKAGETLSGIARRYRISVAQLASRNGIHNGRIYAGQKLSLMESIVQAAPASKPAVAVKRPTKTRVAGTAKKPGAKPAKQTTNRSGSRTQVAYINRRD